MTKNTGTRTTAFPRTAVIKLTDTFKTCPSLKNKGSVSGQRVRVIRDGMTVEQYLEALKAKSLPAGLGNLQACVKQGYILVGKAKATKKAEAKTAQAAA